MLQETQAHPGVTLAVCGFAFSADKRQVALVRKLRPAFQAGLLNGIGGKIEPGERPVSAMVREFREETGYLTRPRDWQRFLVLDTPGWRVHFFRAFDIDLSQLLTTTDEPIEVKNVSTLSFQETLRNVQWLVPLCLDDSSYRLPLRAKETT